MAGHRTANLIGSQGRRRAGSLSLGVLALAGMLALTACGSATNPRLESVAAPGDEPVAAAPTTPLVKPSIPPATDPPPCTAGDYQWEIEVALSQLGNYGPITVDGVQSEQDCQTISNFQKRMGIGTFHGYQYGSEHDDGQPGPITKDVAERLAATDISRCGYSERAQACVDLEHQTFFIVQQGVVLLGPTVTRTGMAGYSTWPGKHQIMDRAVQGWSEPYQVILPYWQHFRAGQGLHETTTYIHDMWRGSHGCVNLLHQDAETAFGLLQSGSTVFVYGVRPGTTSRGGLPYDDAEGPAGP